MDIFLQDKVKRVQEYIVKLYRLKKQDGTLKEIALRMQQPEAFENWASELREFEIRDIIEAINVFHKSKNNNTPPKIYQIICILKANVADAAPVEEERKPICPVREWQDDFDKVLKNACMHSIVYNPYWSRQNLPRLESCKISTNSEGRTILKKYKMIWDEAVCEAKRQNPSSFEKIKDINDGMVEYTLAYRLGYLDL